MSRTDVHAPWHVKNASPYWQYVLYHSGRNIYCGCRLCTGHYDRKLNRRIERMRQRVMLTELRKLSRQDIEEIATFVPRAQHWTIRGKMGTP